MVMQNGVLAGVLAGPGLLPRRVTPRLMPRLLSYASRVTAKTDDFTPPGGEVIPGATLVAKLISNSKSPTGDLHEYYALMSGGDPEGVMDLVQLPEGEGVYCEVARLGAARMHILLDDVEKFVMPELTSTTPLPAPGFVYFNIPKPV